MEIGGNDMFKIYDLIKSYTNLFLSYFFYKIIGLLMVDKATERVF